MDTAPVAPHTAPLWIEKDHADKAGHLADTHCAVLDNPDHTVHKAEYMVDLVVEAQMVDSTHWVVAVAGSTH